LAENRTFLLCVDSARLCETRFRVLEGHAAFRVKRKPRNKNARKVSSGRTFLQERVYHSRQLFRARNFSGAKQKSQSHFLNAHIDTGFFFAFIFSSEHAP
jgi:hypothetical protein